MPLPDPEAALREMRGDAGDTDKKKRLPPLTTLEVDVKTAHGRYKGKFLFEVPSIGRQIDIGRLKCQYLPQGAAADVNSATIVDIICYLTVCIRFTESHPKPDWWDPLNAYTLEPYTQLYGRCLDYEGRFHGRGEDNRADESGPAASGQLAGDDSIRVGEEIQPAAKRSEVIAGNAP